MDYPFDPAVAAAFLARVEAGGRINDLLGAPGMPSQRAYRHWRKTDAGFAAAVGALRVRRYRVRTGHGHGRWRAWDEAVGDRLLLAVMKGAPMRATLATDPAFPSLTVLGRWRVEQPDWAKALKIAMRVGRLRRAAELSRAQAQALSDEVGLKVFEGASLRRLGAWDPDLPCARTLYGWRRRWPEFARAVALAQETRDWLAADARLEAVLGPDGVLDRGLR